MKNNCRICNFILTESNYPYSSPDFGVDICDPCWNKIPHHIPYEQMERYILYGKKHKK